MSGEIEDINVQLLEFGGENGVQALVKLDKTYRITISNEEIQNSIKDNVPSLTQEEMDDLEDMPTVDDNASPEQEVINKSDEEVNEETNPDDKILKELNDRLEELHNNFEEENKLQIGGQTLDQVSIALAIALLNNNLQEQTTKSVTSDEDDDTTKISELEEPNNKNIVSNILENGKILLLSIQSIEKLNTEDLENHLEDIKTEIKDKEFPKTQNSIKEVEEIIDSIKEKNNV
jgi:hypothetical protein